MYSFKVTDVNQALQYAIEHLLNCGVEEPSRNGPVLAAPEPVCIEFTQPRSRVLYSHTRDANPWFHVMEALWMLAGDNDIAFPCFFNKTYGQYSDDNSTMWDAYGWRWRSFMGWDQLAAIVQELKVNPASRRCVLTMWAAQHTPNVLMYPSDSLQWPSNDDFSVATHGGKCVPCLGGETVLQSPEGKATLRELAQQFKSGVLTRWPVFTMNPTTKAHSISWCTKVWKTGRRKLYAVKFDDGTIVRATLDHKFFLKIFRDRITCEEVELRNLRPGDRVWAAPVHTTTKGYETYAPDLARDYGFHNYQKVHHSYYELCEGELPQGYIVHHEDKVKNHNFRNNLTAMTISEHNRLHRLGDSNPMRKLTKAQHRRRADKQSTSLTKNWARRTDAELRQHSRNTSKGLLKSWASLTSEQRKARSIISPTKERSKSLKLSAIKTEWWREKKLFENHVVVSIEPYGVEDVFDFEVPKTHNAMLDNGVFVHNCNTHAYVDLRGGVLNLTVLNRSNDLIFGMLGANVVHMSMLQEYLATQVGVPVGVYRQFTNNMHVYLDKFPRVTLEVIAEECREIVEDQWPLPSPGPAIEPGFDDDLALFMEWARSCMRSITPESAPPGPLCQTAFINTVAVPMMSAWLARKAGRPTADVLLTIDRIAAPDWQRACREWVLRRGGKK